MKKSSRYVAVKSIQIFEKERRKQLLNDIKALTSLKTQNEMDEGVSPFLVRFYGAYLDEGKISLF